MSIGAVETEDCYDVLCVGAGPVALLLSLLLKKRGVAKVAVVDRQPARYPLPRAVCLDHESQRTLWSAGLGPRLEPLLEDIIGPPGTNFSWKDANGDMIVDLKWEEPTQSGWNRASGFSQPQLEGAIEEACIESGVSVFRGLELKSLVPHDDSVSASFNDWPVPQEGPTPVTMRARYLIGADGANSTVRGLCGIEFKDLGFQYDWLVCDMLTKSKGLPPEVEPHKNGAQICDPKRPTTFAMAGPGRRRVEFMRLPTESKEEFFCEKKGWDLLRPWGFSEEYVSMERIALYTFRARWAECWRQGRILLAGDACHQMPPFLGQGMNSGLRDAAALAWRLPLALRGDTSELLLDSYNTERLAHVRAIIDHSVLLGKVICETDEAKAAQNAAHLRANPPPHGFDPHLGQPGILTDHPFAGLVALQRKVSPPNGGKADLVDHIYGCGWRLLTLDETPALSEQIRTFFSEMLAGKVITLSATEDVTGEYHRWMKDELRNARAVLWRPDHYVYGACERLEDVEAMLDGLRSKVCA